MDGNVGVSYMLSSIGQGNSAGKAEWMYLDVWVNGRSRNMVSGACVQIHGTMAALTDRTSHLG